VNGNALFAGFPFRDLADGDGGFAMIGERSNDIGGIIGGTDSDHSNPAIERPGHFVGADATAIREPAEDRRHGPGLGVKIDAQALRNNPGNVFPKTAAGDMGEALDLAIARGRKTAFDIDLRRYQQRLTETALGVERRLCAVIEPILLDDAADQREPVRMHPRRRQAEDNIGRRHISARQQPIAFGSAHGEPRQIVISIPVHAGHFSGFTPDQRTSGKFASLGNAGDNGGGGVAFQPAGGEIVEKEKGFGALDNQIVDAHGDKIDAYPIVTSGGDGYFELRADTIRCRNENRIFVSGGFRIEQRTETADAGHDTFAVRCCGEGFDRFNQLIAGIDVDARILVTEAFCRGPPADLGNAFLPRLYVLNYVPTKGQNILDPVRFAMIDRICRCGAGRGIAYAVLFAGRRFCLAMVASVGLFAVAALSPLPATAQSVFTVSDLAVDEQAETASAARAKALADGERRAFYTLLRRLVIRADWEYLPQLEQEEIAPFIQDFAVADEKTSSVRYLAKLSYRFKPDLVRRFLRNLSLDFAETPSKPVLVLPVYQLAGALSLWDEPNPWREAWRMQRDQGGLVPFVLPIGDLQDIAAIGAEQAVKGDIPRLDALADRYDVDDTMVALASFGTGQLGRPTLQISTSRYGAGSTDQTLITNLTANQTESVAELLRRAAVEVAEQVEDQWKRDNLLRFGQLAVLPTVLQIASLAEWIEAKRRLAQMAVIDRIDLILLSRNEVRLNIHFLGDVEQLRLALAQSDIALSEDQGIWSIKLEKQDGSASRPVTGN